jgi:methyl-accepting chemotaxis protein/methyl-accepting chemotaxis protein-1 (serine sensor receptor)
MGFAVVADEVRNLAQRSAQAARDTAELIATSIIKSSAGKTKVDQVAVAIRGITGESAKIKALVDQVNLGSQEQTRGVEQVAKAITQMEQATQKHAASAEEAASAAEEQNAQSEALKETVRQIAAVVG